MMHAKVMTVDGVVANIGSANLNSRSTACDEEINVVALDPELVRILDEQFDADLERSVRIKAVRWERRTLPQRVAEHARHARSGAGSSAGDYRLRGDGDRCPADPCARGAGRVTSTGTSPSIESPARAARSCPASTSPAILDDDVIAEIRRALLDHQVIFFREQSLTPEQQVAFSRRFGPYSPVPFVEPLAGHPEVIAVVREPSEQSGARVRRLVALGLLVPARAADGFDPARDRSAALRLGHDLGQPVPRVPRLSRSMRGVARAVCAASTAR